MKDLLFRNQYLITDKANKTPQIQGLKKTKFLDLYVYSKLPLEINQVHDKTISILLVGYALDPFNPSKSNEEIICSIAEHCTDKESMFNEVYKLSGRFMMIYKNEHESIVTGDAAHLRQIYYSFRNDTLTLTSSPKLFLDFYDLELKSGKQKKQFVNSEIFNKTKYEHAWYGNESIDDRLFKLLPNHYLNLKNKKVRRTPVLDVPKLNNEDLIGTGIQILKNTYEALVQRDYHLIQPLTAGWDSRVLLAASKDHKDLITYYVFDRDDNPTHQDIRVPKSLSNKLGINFTVFKTQELSSDFLNVYKKNHIIPRILPKTQNIQYHLYKHNNEKTININGNTAEILSTVLGNSKIIKQDPKIILSYTRYIEEPHIVKSIYEWYDNSIEFATEQNINLFDLFYWEQVMGNKGAQYPFEQDLAIEEISPFNNKFLLLHLYQTGYKMRKKPNRLLFRTLAKLMWPEVLIEKINPDKSYLKSLAKKNAIIRHYITRLKLKFE